MSFSHEDVAASLTPASSSIAEIRESLPISIPHPSPIAEIPASPPDSIPNPSPNAEILDLPNRTPNRTKAQILESLPNSIAHRVRLGMLYGDEDALNCVANSLEKSVRRLCKELYQIIGFYALFQGVIFTAVAQSNLLTCADSWAPAVASVAVSVGTICGVVAKLCRIGLEGESLKQNSARASAVFDKIYEIRSRGQGVDLEAEVWEVGHGRLPEPRAGCGQVLSIYGFAVLAFLLFLSTMMVVSCRDLLCHKCKCIPPP